MTAGAAGAVPDDVIEEVAAAIHAAEVGWRHALGTNTPKRIMVARAAVRAHLSVPSVAEVFARDAKVRELAEDIVWLAKLAQGSSWPGEMADRVQRAADRVVSELGSDADRAAIAALRRIGSE